MLELFVNLTVSVRSAMVGLFNRTGPAAVACDFPCVAYELRPISYKHNTRVVIGDKSNLTGYYTEKMANKIVLVRTDSIFEYTYSEAEDFEGAISELNAAAVPVIDFRRGIVKLLLSIGIFVLLLQIIASFGPLE